MVFGLYKFITIFLEFINCTCTFTMKVYKSRMINGNSACSNNAAISERFLKVSAANKNFTCQSLCNTCKRTVFTVLPCTAAVEWSTVMHVCKGLKNYRTSYNILGATNNVII